MGEQDTSNQGYTASQVDSYLSRISFPVKQWPKIIAADARSDAGLAYLTKLMKYQISTVPFENLSLHYSKFPGLSLDKEDLFEKIVVKRRGGYCMELNYLFATVLKTLGYEVVHAGARVYDVHITSPPWGEPGGWGHQVNLVRIGDTIYAVDVGFGGPGMTRPLPLTEGKIFKWGATSAEMRMRYERPKSLFMQGLWVYEHRHSDSDLWVPIYLFGMTEFTQEDYKLIMCHLMIYDEKVDDITGSIFIMEKVLKRRIQAQSEVLATFKSEEERVQGLKTHFGVVLSESDRAGIRGSVAEIK